LGSIHILKPEMYPLTRVIEDAFDSSTSFAVEVNSTSPENVQRISQLVKEGMYAGKETIEKDLSPQLYQQMVAWVTKRGVPVEKIGKLKPWMAALVLQQIQLGALGLSAEHGVERYFFKKIGRKEIVELESVDEQMTMLSSLDGKAFLAYTIADMERTEAKMAALLQAWRCGNTSAFNQITFGNVSPGSEALLDMMFYSRNEKMAQKIKGLVESGKRSFVVVGAAHLVGERNLLELLQRSGLTVEQM